MKATRQAQRSLLLVSAALFATTNAQAVYVFTTVDYPGSSFTDVRGINNVGQIVGYTEVTPNGFTYSNGIFSALTAPPGYAGGASLAINDRGTIVGQAYDANFNVGVGYALTNGVYQYFSHPGYQFTEARAINNAGLITGFAYSANGASPTVGFIYDPTTSTFTDLSFSTNNYTIAQGINTAGQVVGSTTNGSSIMSFFRDTNGTITTFQVNGLATRARGINDQGLITGFLGGGSGFVGSSQGYQVLTISGAAQTIPEGINNAGQISGFYIDMAGGTHGFIGSPASLPVGTTVGGAFVFNVTVIANVPIFIDPIVAAGYSYATGAGDPNFATVELPIGIGDSLYTLSVGGLEFLLAGGDVFDFRNHGFLAGVDTFSISGIELSAGLDPTNPNAFITQISFVSSGRFTGTQTPLLANTSVPEPETIGLMGIAALIALSSRRSGRAKRRLAIHARLRY